MSQPTTAPKERKPLGRIVALIETSAIGESLVEIRMQKSANRWETTFYIVTPFPSDFGSAFRLEKQGPEGTVETYDVCLDHDGAGRHLCGCRGFGKHGHCKHTAGIAALVAAEQLHPIGREDDIAEREAIEAETAWAEAGYGDLPEDESAFWQAMGHPDDGADMLPVGEPDAAA